MLRLFTVCLVTFLFVSSGASGSCGNDHCAAIPTYGASAGNALLQIRGIQERLSKVKEQQEEEDKEEEEFTVLDGAHQSCSEAGMEDVAESDCEAACQIQAVTGMVKGPRFRGFKKKYWARTFPKCFVVASGPYQGNCHWNENPNAPYTNRKNRAICRNVADAEGQENNQGEGEGGGEGGDVDEGGEDSTGAPEPATETQNAADGTGGEGSAGAPEPATEAQNAADGTGGEGDGPFIEMQGGRPCQQLCVMEWAGKCKSIDTSPGKAPLVKDRTGCMGKYSWAKDGGLTPCVINRGGKCHKNINRNWKCRDYTTEEELRAACRAAGASPDREPWSSFD